MKKILFFLAILAIFFSPKALAAGIQILNVSDKVDLVAVGSSGEVQTSGFYVEPKLASPPGNNVTMKASLTGNIGLSITSGSSLVFTPSDYGNIRTNGIFVKVTGTLVAGQASTLTLSGSGLITKTVSVAVVSSGTSGSGSTSGSGTILPQTIDASALPGTSFSLDQIFSRLIGDFIWVIAVAAFAGIIYSGFMYITAGGDSSKAEAARKNLTWSIIGILLAVASYAIVTFVAGWLNIDTTRTNNTNTTTTGSPSAASTTSSTGTPGDTTSSPTSFTSTPGQ